MRIFRYNESITLNTSPWRHTTTKQRNPWKLGPSCGKRTGKHVRYSVILLKLLDKFSRVRHHGFVQNTSSFVQSRGHEILRNWASLMILRCIARKFAEIEFVESFPNRTLDKKALTSRNVVIPPIFGMNFTETNL